MSEYEYPQDSPQVPVPLRRVQRREERPVGAAIVADVSYSMSWGDDVTFDVNGFHLPDGTPVGQRRIDRLAKVLAYVLTYTRLQCLVAFNDVPMDIVLEGHVRLPEPSGSTALHLALEHVHGIRPVPLRCMVLSDGSPNDVDLALRAARSLRPMVIDAYYVGPDGNEEALAFMRELARSGGPGGKSGVFDLSETRRVGEAIRLLLTGPR